VPALLSSLIKAPAGDLAGALAAGGDRSRACLREWLAGVPDHRSVMGRWHPLEFVLALAICAFTAAGHDSPAAAAEWAAGCSQRTLAVLGGRRDPWAQRIRAPTRRECEQRRAARAGPDPPGLLGQVAADGKTVRGAVRPDGSQVHLLSVFDVATGCVRAQREIDAKTNEIPELAPVIAHLDLIGQMVTLDALHTQTETARHLVEDKHAHYLMIIKANQPTLLESAVRALAGPDADYTGASWADEGKGHGRRERRAIRTAPADGIDWPHATQILRIRRDSGPTRGPWTHKEIAYGITSLPADLAGPRHLAFYARNHWAIENREHYVRDKTWSEDLQRVRTGNQPNAYAAIRNLVTGAFRRAGFANIAHARRYYGRDDQRILALYGYA